MRPPPGKHLQQVGRPHANVGLCPGARNANWPSTGKSAFESSSSFTSVRMPKSDSFIGKPPAAKIAVNNPPTKPQPIASSTVFKVNGLFGVGQQRQRHHRIHHADE